MTKKPLAPDEYDSPWKGALQLLLQAFLEFFFADIAADINWMRGYESLDNELQKIARRAKIGKRIADKLFKVWLQDGSEHWLLIHIEIQSEYDKYFPVRMLQYNIAAYQMYNRDVISLAVLCDDRPDWRPSACHYGKWGCKTELIFRIAKLLDYEMDVSSLEASHNPFAAVVLADYRTRETKHDPDNRKLWKLRIVKGLYEQNWPRERIVGLFLLIDWMMELPEGFRQSFDSDMASFEEEKSVQYVSSIERSGIEKGRKEGREEGREEGRKGIVESIEIVLDAKFGSPGVALMPKVRRLSELKDLRKFVRFLKKAENVAEVREYFQ